MEMKLQEQHGRYMGEVRVKVKLTNTADAAAAAAGKLPAEAVRTVEADALVDRGAIRSCVPGLCWLGSGFSLWKRSWWNTPMAGRKP